MEVSGKSVALSVLTTLKMLPLKGMYQCGMDSQFREILLGYLSVSLSLTLSRNEIIEQYITKKTYKLIALRF